MGLGDKFPMEMAGFKGGGDSGILVMGTMSSGKTSFINSLVGREILPSANEATTACLTSVEHSLDEEGFYGASYSFTGEMLTSSGESSLSVIREWNANSETKNIILRGRFATGVGWQDGLVIHDTPGPNNSQDKRHAQLMFEALEKAPYRMLCYVINVSQFGINDDRHLLSELNKAVAKKAVSIFFVLNKIDLLDQEKGESVEAYRRKSCQYLEDAGFENPVVLPAASHIALVARKSLGKEKLTRSQRLTLRQALDEMENDFSYLGIKRWKYLVLCCLSVISRKPFYKRYLKKKKLKKIEYVSGIKAVEEFVLSEFGMESL